MPHSDKIQLETDIPVKEIMRRNPKSIDYNATVTEAAREMCSQDVTGSCIVLKDNLPIGIITELDINCKVVAKNKSPSKTLVEEIMTEPLITIRGDLHVQQAIEIMVKNRVRRLPVVNAEKKLIGIITVRDIMALGVTINELLRDLAEINRVNEGDGICSRCGCMSDSLSFVDGRPLCPNCKADESI